MMQLTQSKAQPQEETSYVDRVTDAWLAKHAAGVKFVEKTVAYIVIILALIYLYDYSGVAGGHFIYNEF
ncbi:hypothetical protein GCM10022296_22100 [Secundilactobacillus similis DSM 23365 = JCM 2765]